jgi:DnaJ-domain-containing protein 1
MAQQSNLPGRFNPYKAAAQETETARQAHARYDAFCESVKHSSPKLYQEHLREKASRETNRILHEAMLDDPEMIAFMDDISRQLDEMHAKSDSAEFALLGIEPGATKRDVKNAYRRQARKLHPDKGGDAEAFKTMYAAYRKLLTIVKE